MLYVNIFINKRTGEREHFNKKGQQKGRGSRRNIYCIESVYNSAGFARYSIQSTCSVPVLFCTDRAVYTQSLFHM